MFKQLITSSAGLMLFKKGPQDFPYSPAMAAIWLIISVAILAASAIMVKAFLPITTFVFGLAVLTILLFKDKKQDRWVQTTLAFIACAWVVNITFIIFTYLDKIILMHYLGAHGITADMIPTLPQEKLQAIIPTLVKVFIVMIMLLIFLWKLSVDTSIVKQALEKTTPRAVFYVFIMNFTMPFIQMLIMKSS
jgi:hypothetical protein